MNDYNKKVNEENNNITNNTIHNKDNIYEHMIEINKIYNFNTRVDYLEQYNNTHGNIHGNNIELERTLYQKQLSDVLMIERDEQFIEKVDVVYDIITNYDSTFMDYLLICVLSNNKYNFKHKDENGKSFTCVIDSDTKELDNVLRHSVVSNSLYFYFMCSSLNTIFINNNENFNVYNYIKNTEFRKLVFGMLFSFQCFQYLHIILKLYINIKSNNLNICILNEPENAIILNNLSTFFNNMWQ
jgi:hypothetical protein